MSLMIQHYRNISHLKNIYVFLLIGFYQPSCQKDSNNFKPTKPNILIIYANDLGYGDLISYGGNIPTPNIDKIRNEGIRFSTPSSYSLLPGAYPHCSLHGLTNPLMPVNMNEHYLDAYEITITKYLKSKGFSTTIFGKWHLGLKNYENIVNSLQLPPEYIQSFKNIQYPYRKAYAAMVASMDDNIARIFDKLRELQALNNTIICFISDNGGYSEKYYAYANNDEFRGEKGILWEGGIKIPAFLLWGGKIFSGQDTPLCNLDVLPTLLQKLRILYLQWKEKTKSVFNFLINRMVKNSSDSQTFFASTNVIHFPSKVEGFIVK